ncbi:MULTISPECIES: GRAM domain-containing protein [unclassified Hahella]|uniref:GRAM domain-containing protein n=1 Tax=unclassified Hahella TaxID=2624107 RepID=UPI000FDE4DEF|nr:MULTISPECIES: GRAM domain-containing protein [unclassified Hahella]AZZ93534.1 hypothetical protein ENC22_20955 [Hahella sp. KA22]MBU6953517.1 hypothetical protein [Hahella sp. HN01]QAY56909.1 hypothetical protein EUZ85_23540 [Hahella sp. KA22]WLQ11365.1 GRAM domain-containing protein [Hahella sp. HNIBRBA332]
MIHLAPGEDILKEGAANLQKNVETVGGKLYLTNQRLVFRAHALNVQGGVTEIPLAQVCKLTKCWTKLFGVVPLYPNSLAISTHDNTVFRFVLFGRDSWRAAIAEQVGAPA